MHQRIHIRRRLPDQGLDAMVSPAMCNAYWVSAARGTKQARRPCAVTHADSKIILAWSSRHETDAFTSGAHTFAWFRIVTNLSRPAPRFD
jgi:hypothetical protein